MITSIFKSLYFLKWCPIFETSIFSKFNDILWVCWFLGKNLSNLYPPFENSRTPIAILPLLSTFLKILVASSLNFLLEQINGYCPDPFPYCVLFCPNRNTNVQTLAQTSLSRLRHFSTQVGDKKVYLQWNCLLDSCKLLRK